jgi:hypothetical protein
VAVDLFLAHKCFEGALDLCLCVAELAEEFVDRELKLLRFVLFGAVRFDAASISI